MLSKDQKKELKRISHEEKTTVFIGKNGLMETVYETFETSMLAHNLVKVSIQKNSDVTILEAVEAFEDRFSCDLVSKIGRVAVFYRFSKNGRIKV